MAAEKAILLTKKAKNIRRLSEGYETLSDIQKLQGNYKEALEIFAAIIKQESVPEGLRLRARMMVQVANQNVRFKS